MAVLDAYPGLTTTITVNKEALTEYVGDEETSPTEVTKYVEARSGAEFMIRTIFTAPFPTTHGVEIGVFVDANRGSHTGVAPRELMHLPGFKVSGVKFWQGGRRFLQKYQFAELNVVEEADDAVDPRALRKEIESKGCIEVSYRWVHNFRSVEQGSGRQTPRTPSSQDAAAPMPRRELPAIGVVPEKVLKGDSRSHQAVLGKTAVIKSGGTGVKYDFMDRKPFGIMRFHYRSLAALKALQIVVEPETEPKPTQEPTLPPQIPQENPEVKPEVEAQSRVKREQAQKHEREDDDMSIVQVRRCKRPRGEQEVIVLD